jgi:hypothetical protein
MPPPDRPPPRSVARSVQGNVLGNYGDGALMGLYSCVPSPFRVEQANIAPTAEGPAMLSRNTPNTSPAQLLSSRKELLPREDEDPDFAPESYPAPAETEARIPTPDDPEEEADADTAPAPGHAESVQLMTIAASSHPRLFSARPSSARRHTPPPPPPPPADVAL